MFRKAERKKAKLRLGILGPSGSGKTYSSLMIAHGLAGRVALIDTEHGSGELYSHLMEYDVAILTPPFSPEKYIQCIKQAEKEYDILIIDSLSHAWAGEGGVLEMHDKATSATRNSFTAWREVTPLHNSLVEAILQSSLHIIATMRTKTAYEITEENGKKKVTKVGLQPVQRDGMEYEFTAVFDLSIDGHVATASKDRTMLFDGKHFKPSADTGRELLDWLDGGVDPIEKSRELFEDLKRRMILIDNLHHLRNWWNKHASDIEQLTPEHKAEMTRIKDEMKTTLNNGQKAGAL